MEGQIPVILRHMEAKSQVVQTHIKENTKNIWTYALIPMYTCLSSISTYINENGIKIRIQQMGDSMKMGNTFWPNLAMKTSFIVIFF